MEIRVRLVQALREPLVHFLLAGAGVFLFFGVFGSAVDAGDRRIIVNEAQVSRLASQWSQTWQRPPSPVELDSLIRDHIKEEIYVREALRLGLDKDDMVVRRRLRAKMEFLATSEAENAAPTDAELQKQLDTFPARYATDPVLSFDQVYVSTDRGGAAANAKARELLARLQAGAPPQGVGDPLSLPQSLDAVPSSDIDRQFGEGFATALKSAPTGRWSGPVASGFGLHLVRVRQALASHKPTLAAVRQAVENDWRDASRQSREAQAYQALLDGYKIEIERSK